MKMLYANLEPGKGIGDIPFLSAPEEAIKVLKAEDIPYEAKLMSNEGCSPEVPWIVIVVKRCVSLFYAREKLWKVYCEKGFLGRLSNGIQIGTSVEEAQRIDPSLRYDEWNEVWTSSENYELEDDLSTKEVSTITIFIDAYRSEDEFFAYRWAEPGKWK